VNENCRGVVETPSLIPWRPERPETTPDNDAGTAVTTSINPPTSTCGNRVRKTSTVTPASDI
jgi:hypothetical protein